MKNNSDVDKTIPRPINSGDGSATLWGGPQARGTAHDKA